MIKARMPTHERIRANRQYRRRLADKYAEKAELESIYKMILAELDRRFSRFTECEGRP